MAAPDTELVAIPIIKVDGAEIAQTIVDRLGRVQVSLMTGTVGHAEIHVDNTDRVGASGGSIDDKFAIGQELQIGAVTADGSSEDIFKGTITSIGVRIDARRNDLVIEALDGSRKLSQALSTKSYLNIKVSDIVGEIAGAAGLTPKVVSTTETFDHHQRFDTPHQFLDRLVAEYGFEWFVDDSDLVVRPRESSSPIELELGTGLLGFNGRTSGTELPKSVEVRGWDSKNKKSISATSKLADGTTMYSNATIAASSGPLKDDPESVATTFRSRISSAGEAQDIADGLANRLNAMRVSGQGECDVKPKIKPGTQVKLSGVGASWEGDYHVSGVDHVWGKDQSFMTRFTVGPIDHATVTDLLGGGGMTGSQRLGSGVSIGIVTDNDDPDGLGRVKVKLQNVSDESVSWWARVISPGAGPERGQLVVPEIDDEVAVAFENGDLQRPYVLGGLWNGTDKPFFPMADVVKGGEVLSRSLVSRSGNYVLLHDEKEKERYIEIKTADEQSWVKVAEDGITVHADAMPIKIENKKSSIELTDAGAITVTAKGGDILLDAKTNNVTIKGNNIELKATGSLKTSSNQATEIKGKAGVKVDGSPALTEIKGSLVKLN